jgi:hypothetical protein
VRVSLGSHSGRIAAGNSLDTAPVLPLMLAVNGGLRGAGVPVIDFIEVWRRIVELQGQTFHQKTGRPFAYTVAGGSVVPTTTNRQLPKSHFARAYERVPLRGPGQLQDLQGPSYLYAILTDPRVLSTDMTGPGPSRGPVVDPPDHRRSAGRIGAGSQTFSDHRTTVDNPDPVARPGGASRPLRLGHRISPSELANLGFAVWSCGSDGLTCHCPAGPGVNGP